MATVKNYLSLIKFSHTIFALPFAIIGFALASTESAFNPTTLIFIILCMVFARSSCFFNIGKLPTAKLEDRFAIIKLLFGYNTIHFIKTC